MSSWPSSTKKRLLFVLVVGLGVLLAAWFGLVAPLQAKLGVQRGKEVTARGQLHLLQTGQDRGPGIRALVEERKAEMANLESLMATWPNLLGWGIGELVPYFNYHGVTHQSWERPVMMDVDVPPEVPYRMARLAVTGQAHYHAFGRFLAAFESSSPFSRITSLSLQAVTPGYGGVVEALDDLEQLRFRMEFQILTVTNRTDLLDD
jgi:Tfp pilus assembly protein PilO